ncbi:hypothetical protein [Bacillus weihaiensis]|uniref:hypothetical protein n=1 Tax=Bacillus weihaiensis TaxID=1547283 RepID=UPI0023536FB6|nr:hypothetical protein [Bacillus weihaiensis]
MEPILKVKEMADTLGISESTVKKYYLLFEEDGYYFNRNIQGNVVFSNYDISLFNKFINMKNQPGMTIKKVLKLILGEIRFDDSLNKGNQNEQLVEMIINQNQKILKMEEDLKSLEGKYEFLIEYLKDNQDINVKRSHKGPKRLTFEF